MGPVAVVLARRLAAALLLVGTVLGVASLHTLGHEAGGHGVGGSGAGGSAGSVPSAQDATVALVAVTGAGVPCEGERCHWMSAVGGRTSRGSSLWDICLAVLTGSVLLLLVRGSGVRSGAARAGAGGSSRHRLRPRPPPGRGIGLAVTVVSALRI